MLMKNRRDIVLVSVLIISVFLVLNFIVPPIQNPDETKNFGAIMIFARGEDQKPAVEKEIIRMMDRNNWWKHLGRGRPPVLPANLAEIDFLFLKDYSGTDFRVRLNEIVLYHFIMGKAVAIAGLKDVESAYYLCRLMSFLFIVGAIFLAMLTFAKISAKSSQFFRWGVLFIIFLPQFLLGMVSVNADVMAVFLSMLFFHAVVSLLSGEWRGRYFLTMIITGVLGLFTDRSTFILLPLGVLTLFFLIRKKNYREYIVSVLAFFIVLFMLAALLINLFPLQAESSLILFGKNLANIGKVLPGLFSFGEFNREMFAASLDGFLFKFGWAAFGAAGVFYYFWRSLVVVSFVGGGVYLAKYLTSREKNNRRKIGSGYNVKLLLFFSLAAFLQLAAVWAYYGSKSILGQGRYFFPLIVPLVYIFFLGIKTVFDLFHKDAGRIAVAALIVLEFFFLNYCVWQYIIPVFHMTIKSPVAGV